MDYIVIVIICKYTMMCLGKINFRTLIAMQMTFLHSFHVKVIYRENGMKVYVDDFISWVSNSINRIKTYTGLMAVLMTL